MSAYKTVSYVGFVIMIFGLVIAGYGFSFLLRQNDLEANGIRVKGTVTEINENAIYRSPYVKFETLEGEEITFLSDLEVNHSMFNYVVGQEVKVIYHKDNPNQAKIDAFWEAHFGEIFLGSFGLFLMLLGMFIRWLFLRKAKRYAAQYR